MAFSGPGRQVARNLMDTRNATETLQKTDMFQLNFSANHVRAPNGIALCLLRSLCGKSATTAKDYITFLVV